MRVFTAIQWPRRRTTSQPLSSMMKRMVGLPIKIGYDCMHSLYSLRKAVSCRRRKYTCNLFVVKQLQRFIHVFTLTLTRGLANNICIFSYTLGREHCRYVVRSWLHFPECTTFKNGVPHRRLTCVKKLKTQLAHWSKNIPTWRMKLLLTAARRIHRPAVYTGHQRSGSCRASSGPVPPRGEALVVGSSLELVQRLGSQVEVRAGFITEKEEQALLKELEPGLKKKRYEYDHWDDVSLLYIVCLLLKTSPQQHTSYRVYDSYNPTRR